MLASALKTRFREHESRGFYETVGIIHPRIRPTFYSGVHPFASNQGEEQFRKAMWGFDGEEETPGGTGTGGASGDPCEVDSGTKSD